MGDLWDEKAAALLQLAVRVVDCRVAPAGTDVSYILIHFVRACEPNTIFSY
jgi:hypothetical protein